MLYVYVQLLFWFCWFRDYGMGPVQTNRDTGEGEQVTRNWQSLFNVSKKMKKTDYDTAGQFRRRIRDLSNAAKLQVRLSITHTFSLGSGSALA